MQENDKLLIGYQTWFEGFTIVVLTTQVSLQRARVNCFEDVNHPLFSTESVTVNPHIHISNALSMASVLKFSTERSTNEQSTHITCVHQLTCALHNNSIQNYLSHVPFIPCIVAEQQTVGPVYKRPMFCVKGSKIRLSFTKSSKTYIPVIFMCVMMYYTATIDTIYR